MSETSDALLAELLRDMHKLIDARRPDMSPADLDNAMAWVQSVARTCGDAMRYCAQMRFSEPESSAFMTSLLRSMIECTRLGILEAHQRDSNLSVH